jgi:hypothetical protein
MLQKVIIARKNGYAHDALAGYAMMNISRCKVYDDELDDARESIGKALDFIRDSGVKVIFLEAQLQHASVLLAEGQLEDARNLCENTRKEIKAQGAPGCWRWGLTGCWLKFSPGKGRLNWQSRKSIKV